MSKLIQIEPAESSSVTQETIRWTHDNTYTQVLCNKKKYAGRVRQVGQIFGLCGSPYAHTIHPHSHEHKIKGNPSSRKKWSLLRSRKHLRVSGHDTRHKWMSCWRHNLKLCPVLAKWSYFGASHYPCLESLMIT
jgi:hypothetical protein